MDIIKHKNLFFLLSGLVIIPGVISLLLWRLNFGIDFTGGTKLEFKIQNSKFKNREEVKNVIQSQKVRIITIRSLDKDSYSVRTEAIDNKRETKIIDALGKKFGPIKVNNFETVGPVIGSETTVKAVQAVLIASVLITLYIAFAFRAVSRPVASWKFGVAAIVALLHDVLVVVGIFSLLGHFAGVEVDSLFITALLTVMGFSVHDTIVVFDRIRENLRKNVGLPFDTVVNNSILETLGRSLNTSLTVILVLFSLLLFGGESVRWFIVALLIGIISGTYSSIFNASPLLVLWYEFGRKGK